MAAVGHAAGPAKRDGGWETAHCKKEIAQYQLQRRGEIAICRRLPVVTGAEGRELSRRRPILRRGAVKGSGRGWEGAQGMQVVDSIYTRARAHAIVPPPL